MLRGSQHKIPFHIFATHPFWRLLEKWKRGTVPLVLGHATEMFDKTDG